MTIKRSISRRRAISGAATAGIGVPLLAACGDDGGDSTTSASDAASSAESSPTASGTPTQGESTAAESTAPPPADGIPTSDVPVGGGIVTDDAVITQPSEGEFKAFTNVCTHQQCLVTEVTDGTIGCPCHGSRFSIEDGSVTAGPASQPLGEVGVSVEGDRVVLG
ncbi:(2Fe-2S)-binding protein [Nocardioides silvaticus]|uniref:Cytochrome bc1 complex Rieske iron-sulfur subunit n=1 Tax=Nocardioides silvaticus TaxID=2201891 RepID=A0A316TL39_9ACTN|nr:Rieske (2Fe-2S) protein [Nocardioides silvaticus]PWN03805.1 (2Fe-2S)-binding protein [Nocardioides silvaticus]